MAIAGQTSLVFIMFFDHSDRQLLFTEKTRGGARDVFQLYFLQL